MSSESLVNILSIADTGNKLGLTFEKAVGTYIPNAVYRHPEDLEKYGRMIGRTIKQMHDIHIASDVFVSVKRKYYAYLSMLQRAGILEKWECTRLKALINSIPDSDTLLHQDISLKNIILKDNKIVMIDIDDTEVGHYMFDLIAMYTSIISLSEFGLYEEPEGMTSEQYDKIFEFILCEYFHTEDPDMISEYKRVLRGYSLIRLMCGALVIKSEDLSLNYRERMKMANSYKNELFSVLDTLYPIEQEL